MKLSKCCILLSTFFITSCAHKQNCNSVGNYSDSEIHLLECNALLGDKFAQLELGSRYEGGRGVRQDLHRAEDYYERAARSDSSSKLVYSPAVGRERFGQIVPFGTTSTKFGLPEARSRLKAIRQIIKTSKYRKRLLQ